MLILVGIFFLIIPVISLVFALLMNSFKSEERTLENPFAASGSEIAAMIDINHRLTSRCVTRRVKPCTKDLS